MWWVDKIFSIIWGISDWFGSIAGTVNGWVWPFNQIAIPLLVISDLFWSWLEPIANFGDWADDVWARVQNILTEEGILGLIKWWFPWLEGAGVWFSARWEWFTTQITNWWYFTSTIVLGWIDIAAQEVKQLLSGVETWVASLQASWDDFWVTTFPEWTAKLDTLRSGWDAFWITTFPTLANWTGVSSLIESTLRSWFPFYDDLVEIWNEIVEFFTNPLDFLLTRFTDWFLGPEE